MEYRTRICYNEQNGQLLVQTLSALVSVLLTFVL